MRSAATLITNARIIAENSVIERGWLRIQAGRIAAFDAGDAPEMPDAQTLDAGGLSLLPGFIDLHAHGGGGFEVMAGEVETIMGMARYFAGGGTTAFLATTWTDDGGRIRGALEAIAAAMRMPTRGAQLLGAHLEGPYLNAAKCGAQLSAFIRRASREEALPWLDLDVIRLLALAPEFAENHWLIREAARRGITVAAAHTDATYEQMEAARDMGLRHATHVYNAMSPLHHRQPGAVGACLTLDGIGCELICDLVHAHPAAVDILWRCKGADGLILVTDSVKIAGLPDGRYQVSHQEVETIDGVVRIVESGGLAGTTLSMNAALRNLMKATRQPLEKVWRCASLSPARAIGVDERKGSIAPGKDADLALVDDEILVHKTIVAGEIVYETGDA